MPSSREEQYGIEVSVPRRRALRLAHVVFDFNGTLALDGALLPGLAQRLKRLAKELPLTVLTADTFGTASKVLRSLPVTLHRVDAGSDKAAFVSQWRRAGVAVVGNGNNDVAMLQVATLGIVVLGPEGLSPGALAAADIVVSSAAAGIDLLLNPRRLSATLRR